jgi:hypothetical protein
MVNACQKAGGVRREKGMGEVRTIDARRKAGQDPASAFARIAPARSLRTLTLLLTRL